MPPRKNVVEELAAPASDEAPARGVSVRRVLKAYEQIAGGMRAGSTEGDAIRNASVIGEQGFGIYDDLIHAYGTDYTPPLVDRSCVAYWGADAADPPPGRTIERNMAIVIQPNPITPDERMGVQVGALTIVRDDGAECLHGIPFEPLVAA